MSSSSSDLLAHHKRISSWHHKSRSLDVSCASSYATDDHPTSTTPGANTSMYSKHLNDLQMVPFKWEEAPGKPIITSSSNELISYNPSSLQLPPKLQCQGNQTPLHSLQRSGACRKCPDAKKPTQPCDHGLFRSSPNKPLLKKLSKYMRKTASCTRHAPPFESHSWSSYPPCIEYTPSNHNYNQQNEILFNDRLFFDRYSPKDLRYCASMDSILPIFDANSAREDECVSRKALSFLAMEEQAEDAESVCSPWKPMSFHYERRGYASPCWQPSPTYFKVHGKVVQEEDEDDDDNIDDDDDEGFHDLFSTSSSRKASLRTDGDGMESESSSPSPWYLDFSPEEEEVHVERRESSAIVRLVASIKLKKVISKLKRGSHIEESANHQLTESTMWSPTLATYLYNEQLEEEKQAISTPSSCSGAISANYSAEEIDGRSEMGSNRLQIDPNYYLPSTFRTHLMNPEHENCCFRNPNHDDSDEEEDSIPACGAHQEWQAYRKGTYFAQDEEEDGIHSIRRKLSLKDQLAEFDDDYLAHSFDVQSTVDGHPDIAFKAREPLYPCKGMCKVRKTVRVLASAVKLLLVQTEIGKRKGAQRSFKSYVKPTFSTHFSFHFSQK